MLSSVGALVDKLVPCLPSMMISGVMYLGTGKTSCLTDIMRPLKSKVTLFGLSLSVL